MMLPWWDDEGDWWGRPCRRPVFETLTPEQIAAYRITYGGYEDDEPAGCAVPEPPPIDAVAAAVEIARQAWDGDDAA